MPHSILEPGVRRNDPCPCGSGKRYKECHGALPQASPALAGSAARELFARGDLEEAVRSARSAVERDAGDAEAWTVLGLSLGTADPDAALAALEKAAALAPQQAEPH